MEGGLALYHGKSMYRVFSPGEQVEIHEIAPNNLVCGDIAVITYPGAENVIHRVIRIDHDELQTMGDNNPKADIPVKFNGEHRFYLVTGAVDLQGKYRKVLNGKAGMQQFYRNQRKMKIRRFFRRVLQLIDGVFFWRLPVAELHTFGKSEVYYRKKFPVAKRLSNGRIVYLKWHYRLLYKIDDRH